MKKILIAPLFTMLVVSCGMTLPSSGTSLSSTISSQNESSLISQTTSSSSIVNSSNTTTSSQEPINTRKVPFNQIGTLVAQVVDAKAMGILNSKDRELANGRRNAQGEEQNYMVKVTETYNPNTQITEDQTVQVTFSRITNTQTTELQTGTESYLATAEPLTIERLTDLPGNIVVTNVEGYEYRLLSGDVVIQDWLSSEVETIEFIFDEELPFITIESRSLNASISFIAFEGFNYTIKQSETVIYENLEDNDEPDTNEAVGNITLFGLTEGLTYDVTYAGYKVIETITQDEVEGQVDKLYVLYQYTFISFVPLNLNQRPQDQVLELDYDDVPLYDKQGYFSDSTRQSFVVDNNTGLIYKIENINIASLSGGCVTVKDNSFPYDMRINEVGNLEFFQLHSNPDLVFSPDYEFYYNKQICTKDKWGNKFVMNPKIDYYDLQSNTTYYAYTSNLNNNNYYFLTSTGEIINAYRQNAGSDVWTYKMIDESRSLRNFTEKDNFKSSLLSPLGKLLNVTNGVMYFISNRWQDQRHWYSNFSITKLNTIENKVYSLGFTGWYYNQVYSEGYNILLVFNRSTKQILCIDNFWNIFNGMTDEDYTNINVLAGSIIYWTVFENNLPNEFNKKVVLDQVDEVNLINNIYSIFSLSGTIYYDLILEFVDTSWTINSYISGTYVAPPISSVTLQPINR